MVSEVTTSQDLSTFSSSKGPKLGHRQMKPLVEGDRLLSVRAVAVILSLSTATVYKLIETGALPHVRVSNSIRVLSSDVTEFISSGSPT